ncbi:TfoX/Sxy family protein [Derxia gummosa]|uniref:TfoX/Sxy family protein n=1 Tax=Derxia gummosa DSM 723 TaxID=1121388 RepID=A0A8B6X870_9BURK|nr:TfoX/Sxy family protein [Derxia gummosa]
MASHPSSVDLLLDTARLPGLVTKRMFGEYALYLDGKVVGFICDDQLFVKPTDAGTALLGREPAGIPYPKAKPHHLAQHLLDEPERLRALLLATAEALPPPAIRPPRAARKRAATE